MLLAGFNIHIAHHLFPTADHSILPEINKMLIQLCQ
jgi:fatty acid desaturase